MRYSEQSRHLTAAAWDQNHVLLAALCVYQMSRGTHSPKLQSAYVGNLLAMQEILPIFDCISDVARFYPGGHRLRGGLGQPSPPSPPSPPNVHQKYKNNQIWSTLFSKGVDCPMFSFFSFTGPDFFFGRNPDLPGNMSPVQLPPPPPSRFSPWLRPWSILVVASRRAARIYVRGVPKW